MPPWSAALRTEASTSSSGGSAFIASSLTSLSSCRRGLLAQLGLIEELYTEHRPLVAPADDRLARGGDHHLFAAHPLDAENEVIHDGGVEPIEVRQEQQHARLGEEARRVHLADEAAVGLVPAERVEGQLSGYGRLQRTEVHRRGRPAGSASAGPARRRRCSGSPGPRRARRRRFAPAVACPTATFHCGRARPAGPALPPALPPGHVSSSPFDSSFFVENQPAMDERRDRARLLNGCAARSSRCDAEHTGREAAEKTKARAGDRPGLVTSKTPYRVRAGTGIPPR